MILPHLQGWADPPVAAFSRDDVASAFQDQAFLGEQPTRELLSRLRVTDRARSQLESDRSRVQLVSCALPTHDGRYFTFRRNAKDEKVNTFGTYTLWKGTHVTGSGTIERRLEECLHQRVKDDLHLANRLRPKLVGMAWQPRDNHVGVLYTVEVSKPVAGSMKEKEFKRRARQATISGDFRDPKELLEAPIYDQLESWSKSYLESVK